MHKHAWWQLAGSIESTPIEAAVTMRFLPDFTVQDSETFKIAQFGAPVEPRETVESILKLATGAAVVRHVSFRKTGKKQSDYGVLLKVAEILFDRGYFGMLSIFSPRTVASDPYDAITFELMEKEKPRLEIEFEPEQCTNREVFEQILAKVKAEPAFVPADPDYQHPR